MIFAPCRAEFPQIRFEDRDGTQGTDPSPTGQERRVALWRSAHSPQRQDLFARVDYRRDLPDQRGPVEGAQPGRRDTLRQNHFGSVYRENAGAEDPHRGWNPSHMHDGIMVRTRPMSTYNPLVDLMGHRHLGGKTVLYLIDALYAAPHQSVAPEKWQSAPFDGHWTASLFLSQDPVAIDSVAVDFFAAEPTAIKEMTGSVDNYLHEAALANDAPSKTRYAPDGTDAALPSLGVHEHWNNPQQKQYSRNLGLGRGIELVQGR